MSATVDPVPLAHYCDLVRALVPLFELQVIVTASPVLVTMPFVPESVLSEPAVEDAAVVVVVQKDNDLETNQVPVLAVQNVVLAVNCATDEARRPFADVAIWDSI